MRESPFGMPKNYGIDTCKRCRGATSLHVYIRDLSNLDYSWHVIGCPTCDSKGYVTQQDRERICTM